MEIQHGYAGKEGDLRDEAQFPGIVISSLKIRYFTGLANLNAGSQLLKRAQASLAKACYGYH